MIFDNCVLSETAFRLYSPNSSEATVYLNNASFFVHDTFDMIWSVRIYRLLHTPLLT